MTEKEERVWAYVLRNRQATVDEITDACGVGSDLVWQLLSKIGTPEEVWRNGDALSNQVGGSHYKDMVIQPWQAMEAWLTPEEYRGYHKGVAIAYLAREQQKGGIEDIKKAIHHLQRLVEMQPKETDHALHD